jgi:hypothetical protein
MKAAGLTVSSGSLVLTDSYSGLLMRPVRKCCCVDEGLMLPSKSSVFMLDLVWGMIGLSLYIA